MPKPEPRAAAFDDPEDPVKPLPKQASGGPAYRQCDPPYDALKSFDFLSKVREALKAAEMEETFMDRNLAITFFAPTNQVHCTAAQNNNASHSLLLIMTLDKFVD
jgi:hypothetical protein